MKFFMEALKKIQKKKILFGILIFFVIGVVVTFGKGKGNGVEYATEAVRRQDLIQTVSATGKVTSASEIELKFQTNGKVTAVHKQVGDQLEAGELVAELGAQDLKNRVSEAEAFLHQALAGLERVRAGASPEELKILEVQVMDAKRRLENASLTSKNSIAAAEDSFATAQKNLDIVKSQRTTANGNLVNKILLDSENKLFVAGGSQAVLDGAFGDPDGQGNVGVLYSGSLEGAKLGNENAKKTTNFAKASLVVAKQSTLKSDLDSLLYKTLISLQDTLKALDATLLALSYSTTDSSFTQSDLDALKSSVKTEQTYVNTAITTIQADRSDYNNFDLEYDELTRKAETVLAQADISLDQANANAKTSVDTAQGAHELVIAQYNQRKAPARAFDIRLEEARVASARASLGTASAELEKSRIKAPVGGVLGKLDIKVGDAVTTQEVAAVMVGKANLEIDLDVPESDVVKVSPEDSAEISLDAFGDDVTFSGIVSFIDPAETLISDVVYYTVKVFFIDPNEAAGVKSGMTANVDIQTNFVSDTLVIPYRAVTNGRVRVLENNIAVERGVVLGARGDDGLVEVTSGLSEGEWVIVFENKKK